MKLGYNTNGFAFHTLDDALQLIADAGYTCVALTLDVHHFNPFTVRDREINALQRRLADLKLNSVIETGSRFLLNPKRKHRPTLLDRGNEVRRDFLRRSMDICTALGSECVSYWSGARPEASASGDDDDPLYRRLADEIVVLEEYASSAGVRLALEPEPGFLIERMADYDRLCDLIGRRLGLTIDVGHLICVEEAPPETLIASYSEVLCNVHLDDMRRGVHRHLFFGEGEVDFTAVFRCLTSIGYKGPACVELSDASRDAVNVVSAAYLFLSEQLAEL